jgi:hypothetical protein
MYKIFVGNPDENRPLLRSSGTLVDNTGMVVPFVL